MRKYLLTLVAVLICSMSAWAVMASPEPFEFTKADGTTVMARIYGDEFHSYVESLDGELLRGSRDIQVLNESAEHRRVQRIQHAAGYKTYPTKGSPRSLVLLVSFADLEFGETLQDFRDLLNKSGYNHNGATGSCRDYFIASSDSIFSPQFDCYGPFKVSKNMEYYGGNDGKSTSKHANEMVAEACQLAHEAGVNFKDYDTNNDGVLDNVFVFFAGHNEAEGASEKTIWPHQSNISNMDVRLDGVLAASYACTSEYRGVDGKTRCGIGTFCHEFGHVLGQPDFYDTDYNYYSVSNWDIMCSGCYNNDGNTPPTYSAYERMYLDWLTPKQLTLPGQYTLTDVPFHKEAYLIAATTHNLSSTNPDPNEFFLLDYRSGDNEWDKSLPGLGMIVWHIDYSSSAWKSNTPNNGPTIMRMHLEEANGIGWKKRAEGEPGRASDVYPGTQNVTSFTPTLHNGTQLAQPVFNITEANSVISFTFMSVGGASLRADKEAIELTTTVDDKKSIVDWEPQSFNLFGSGLDPKKSITLMSKSSSFLFYVGENAPARKSSEWLRSTMLQAQEDSTLQHKIWVSYVPTSQNCEPTKSSITISSEAANISMPVSGNAPRPTYVTVPETYKPSDITPYSFTAKWGNQEDAEKFYLTLYQVEEGTTDFTQNFEKFDDMSVIREQGWQSNTTTTTTSDKADGQRALYFKNHGDQITSETYPSPVTTLSFWYNSFAATIDTVGVIEMEAFDGDTWNMEDRIIVSKTSKKVTAKYEFTPEQNYRAFRLTWLDNGGKGAAFDMWVATTSQKINYIKKAKDIGISAFIYGDTVSYTFGDLAPATTYHFQVQATDLDKGCEEHLTKLSAPIAIQTVAGTSPDGNKLSLAYDSINYNPAQSAIYLTDPEAGDQLLFFNSTGELVYSMPVRDGEYVYPLDLDRFKHGEVYLVQHAKNAALKRKNKWLKFYF